MKILSHFPVSDSHDDNDLSPSFRIITHFPSFSPYSHHLLSSLSFSCFPAYFIVSSIFLLFSFALSLSLSLSPQVAMRNGFVLMDMNIKTKISLYKKLLEKIISGMVSVGFSFHFMLSSALEIIQLLYLLGN